MGIEDGELVDALADMLQRDGARYVTTDQWGRTLYQTVDPPGLEVPIHVALLESLGRRVHGELQRRQNASLTASTARGSTR